MSCFMLDLSGARLTHVGIGTTIPKYLAMLVRTDARGPECKPGEGRMENGQTRCLETFTP